MLNCFYQSNYRIAIADKASDLEQVATEAIIWIDLYNPMEHEKALIERKLGVELFTRQEAEEIESSSRYFENDHEINANLSYIYRREDGTYATDPVSFILNGNTLVTQRNIPLRSFEEVRRLLNVSRKMGLNGYNIFLLLFETRIDIEADFLEEISKKIYMAGKVLALDKKMDEEVLIETYNLQQITILFRESTSELKRLFSSILKSQYFPKDEYEKIRVLIKDADSLLGHTSFNFERLEYLQNTFLGLINIEQNKIIKIFTVVTVVFMPPTLIASVYGMNFDVMPELHWKLGYPVSISMMLISSLITLYFFRRQKWL
ncbi:MAG TPA: magnesium/cobalt transporter CorA [Saprospiraceae bacterium]|nr:magnesium/cobalt transporter CorA [Saprospiraceae bacterium]HMP13498.1 magnesium/cobalt transporter CorA [Saprospiraceae bacterium]